MAPAVDAVEQDRPGLGLDQPFDGAQRARLARSVRPEQTEDLSPADLEADRVDCPLRAVSDRQVAHLEDPGDLRNSDGHGGGSAVFGRYRLLSAGDRLGRQQQRSVLTLLGNDVRGACPPLSTCTLSLTGAQRTASAITITGRSRQQPTGSSRTRHLATPLGAKRQRSANSTPPPRRLPPEMIGQRNGAHAEPATPIRVPSGSLK